MPHAAEWSDGKELTGLAIAVYISYAIIPETASCVFINYVRISLSAVGLVL